MDLQVQLLQPQDAEPIAAAFAAIGWNKPASQFKRYVFEQEQGLRTVLVAAAGNAFVGYLTIVWQPRYPAFRSQNIPEIQDLNVLPRFRRQGIGARLMDVAERMVAKRSPVVGIGVGMTADYGAAQRLYVSRGYIPDGRGLAYDKLSVKHGEPVMVDDELVLYFTKELKSQ